MVTAENCRFGSLHVLRRSMRPALTARLKPSSPASSDGLAYTAAALFWAAVREEAMPRSRAPILGMEYPPARAAGAIIAIERKSLRKVISYGATRMGGGRVSAARKAARSDWATGVRPWVPQSV